MNRRQFLKLGGGSLLAWLAGLAAPVPAPEPAPPEQPPLVPYPNASPELAEDGVMFEAWNEYIRGLFDKPYTPMYGGGFLVPRHFYETLLRQEAAIRIRHARLELPTTDDMVLVDDGLPPTIMGFPVYMTRRIEPGSPEYGRPGVSWELDDDD